MRLLHDSLQNSLCSMVTSGYRFTLIKTFCLKQKRHGVRRLPVLLWTTLSAELIKQLISTLRGLQLLANLKSYASSIARSLDCLHSIKPGSRLQALTLAQNTVTALCLLQEMTGGAMRTPGDYCRQVRA